MLQLKTSLVKEESFSIVTTLHIQTSSIYVRICWFDFLESFCITNCFLEICLTLAHH